MKNLGDQFLWFVGVVENRDDPLRLGRCQVRAFSHHTSNKQDLPTEDLPWAQPIQSITSAAMGDVGQTPTGIVEGTWVVGFFMDGDDYQRPVIMGTMSGIPTDERNPNEGFNDPNDVYPKRFDEPDTNRLARNDVDYPHPVLKQKENWRAANSTNIPTSTGSLWSEPATTYDSTYPNNHVYESESGHIREYDDTKDKERIHEYHRSGTFYEIDATGNKDTRIVGNSYEIVAKNDYVYIKGSCNLTIDNDCNTYIKGDWNIKVDGNVNETVGGNVNETVGGNQTTQISGNLDVDASRIDLN